MPSDWQTTTRYYGFAKYLRDQFDRPVRKITVDAGFGCPNRDGTIGVGGCSFCVNDSFSPATGMAALSVRDQIVKGIKRSDASGASADTAFIVYFQPFTNTHADVQTLRQAYGQALCGDRVVGLAVGTRPDCVPDEVLDLIQGYTEHSQVWIEYGVQSSHDRTLDRIGRGHHWDSVVDAVTRTRGRGILVCAHVILGLPGETRDDMRVTAERLALLGIDGIKLHHLAIVRGSRMEAEHERGEITLLASDEYASLAADLLERLPQHVVVQRLVGDTRGDLLVAPKWDETKQQVIAAITAELQRHGTHQGALVAAGVAP